LGRILAANNFYQNVFMLVALIATASLSYLQFDSGLPLLERFGNLTNVQSAPTVAIVAAISNISPLMLCVRTPFIARFS
jgi:hypothetical protein